MASDKLQESKADAKASALLDKTDSTNSIVRAKPAAAVGQPAIIYNGGYIARRDPYTGDRFPSGATVRVESLGSWTHSQIEAGLLAYGEEKYLGVQKKNNADKE